MWEFILFLNYLTPIVSKLKNTESLEPAGHFELARTEMSFHGSKEAKPWMELPLKGRMKSESYFSWNKAENLLRRDKFQHEEFVLMRTFYSEYKTKISI